MIFGDNREANVVSIPLGESLKPSADAEVRREIELMFARAACGRHYLLREPINGRMRNGKNHDHA